MNLTGVFLETVNILLRITIQVCILGLGIDSYVVRGDFKIDGVIGRVLNENKTEKGKGVFVIIGIILGGNHTHIFQIISYCNIQFNNILS